MPEFLAPIWDFLARTWGELQDPKSTLSPIVLVWTLIIASLAFLLWPRGTGRTRLRQIYALAALSFREGLRLKVLWTVFVLALVPGLYAFIWGDADGTHAGRARLILDAFITSGELLGAGLIVLLSALSVAREIEFRIMHTLGAKPVPRWVILTGKALGFWAIDVCFLLVLMLFCAGLVRLVPMFAESRAPTRLEMSGDWEYLKRNALTTRVFAATQATQGSESKEIRVLLPGRSGEWHFPALDAARTAQRSLLFSISSNLPLSHIPGVRITAAAPGQTPFYDQVETVPQGKLFSIFLDPQTTPQGEMKVTITSPVHVPGSAYPPIKLIVPRASGVKLGVAADGFAANIFKAFVLMVIQGWVLALIIGSWSGVLSFPVTVALGVIFVLSGEMSRTVIDLMKTDLARIKALHDTGVIDLSRFEFQMSATRRLQKMLELFPDFRAAGGPSAFVEGTYVPGLAIAHTVLWVGIARGIGWALPGFYAFSKREVGK